MPIVTAAGTTFDVDAVAFDKDGTLIDLDATWGPIATAWIHGVSGGDDLLAASLAHRLGYDRSLGRLVPDSILAAGTLEQIREATVAHLGERLRPRSDGAGLVDAALTAGLAAVAALGPVSPVPLTDLGRLFARFTGAGLRCAVVTSDDRRSVDDLFDVFDLHALVDVVVGGDDTNRPKPAPDPLLLAADRLGVVPSRLLMVGDSTTDQGAARAAGCPFVAVGAEGAAAGDCDAVVAHVGELTVGS